MILVPAEAEKNTRNAVALTNSFRPAVFSNSKNIPGIFLSALSGILLCFCYPSVNFSWLAWIALAPFLFAVSQTSSRGRAVFLGWVFAFSFFGVSLHFLVHVAFAAWPALVFLESLYGLLLGLLLFETRRFSSAVLRVCWIALSWTVVEMIRTEIPVWSFGLNLLGHSQAFHPEVIQIAAWGGAYCLSFVMAAVNALFAEASGRGFKKAGIFCLTAGLIFLAVFFSGKQRLTHAEKQPAESVRLSVIQPNIPQSVKWALMAKKDVIEIHENLTRLAALREPELIIWPEASFPGYFNADYETPRILEEIRSLQTAVLIGSPLWESEEHIFNSVLLVNGKGEVESRYDKMRLVPFGEYVPWKMILGWLEPIAYTMGVGDFSAGTAQTLFQVAGKSFAVLICFEDVFPDLARKAVQSGAHFLTVMTNDAWFGKTGAPWEHFQTSIFRAVENGVPVVRSGNTGISGFISAEGQILNIVRDEQGESRFVTGELTMEVPMIRHVTGYQKGGWLFPYACAILLLVISFFRKRDT